MEYIVGLVAVVVLGLLWHTNRKNKLQEVVFKPAPYKVETPPAVAPQAEPVQAVVEAPVAPAVEEVKAAPPKKASKPRAAKKPAEPKAKPAAKAKPAKKASKK